MDTDLLLTLKNICKELSRIATALEGKEEKRLVPGTGSKWRHATGLVAKQVSIENRGGALSVVARDSHGEMHAFAGTAVAWDLIESAPVEVDEGLAAREEQQA